MRNATGFLLVLMASAAFAQSPEGVKGSVCGQVLDENGLPASHVRVIAIEYAPGGHSGGYPGSTTDASGAYCIKGLELGEYVLSADDKAKGYPRRGPLFFSWQTPDPKVELTMLNPDARSDWQIPFKAGFVKIQIPETRQGNQEEMINLVLKAPSRPQGGFMSSKGAIPADRVLTYLVPPDEDVLLTVTCSGGHKWPDGLDEGVLIHASPGATENITLPASCFEKGI